LLKAGDDIRSALETIILRAFDYPGGIFQGPPYEVLRDFERLLGKRELPLTSLPMLVRFRDPDDPRSVELVDPFNLAKNFGAGARLVGAYLEIVSAGIWPLNCSGITGEAVTVGIEGKLPWWNGPFPWLRPLGGGVSVDTRTEAFKVGKEDFKRG
jgi:hypothetical protein